MLGAQPDDTHRPGPRLSMGAAEDLSIALRRMALEQAETVVAGFTLEPDDALLDNAVHKARKAGKRLRALLRLCRPNLGTNRYGSANTLVRDQCRRLSEIRTSRVLSITLDGLVGEGALSASDVRPLRGLLSARHAMGLAHLRNDPAGRENAQDSLRQLIDSITRHPAPPEFTTLDLAALEPGIRRTYRRARRALQEARLLNTAHAFHEWRKRVNYLRYQMEAVSGACAPPVAALAHALDELSEVLGTDHDLADLLEVVEAAPVEGPAGLPDLIETRSKSLRGHALGVGSELFAAPPRDFVRFLGEQARLPPH